MYPYRKVLPTKLIVSQGSVSLFIYSIFS